MADQQDNGRTKKVTPLPFGTLTAEEQSRKLHRVERLLEQHIDDQRAHNERVDRRLAGIMDILKDVLARLPAPRRKKEAPYGGQGLRSASETDRQGGSRPSSSRRGRD